MPLLLAPDSVTFVPEPGLASDPSGWSLYLSLFVRVRVCVCVLYGIEECCGVGPGRAGSFPLQTADLESELEASKC